MAATCPITSSNVPASCYSCFKSHVPSSCPVSSTFFNPSSWPMSMPSTSMPSFNNWFDNSMPFTMNHPMSPSMWCNPMSSPMWCNPMTMPSMWSNCPVSWPNTFYPTTPFGNNTFNNWCNWFEKSSARHMLPTEIRDCSFRPCSMAEYWTMCNPIQVHPFDGSRLMHLCFEVKGFKPEEINVTFSNKDRCFTVECKHDVKEKEHCVTRTYIRKYCIPSEYSCDFSKCELKTFCTPDGLLIIECCLPRLTAEELKVWKEKCPNAFTKPESTFGSFHSGYACSVPIKTVA